MYRLSGTPLRRLRTLNASLPIMRRVGSTSATAMPSESNTTGRACHTFSGAYGSAWSVVGSLPGRATLIVPLVPVTRMVDDAGAGAALDAEPAQAPDANINNRNRR